MQPAGLTVALATVLLVAWLDVDAVRAAATHHPTHLTLDQYSPLPPQHRRGVYERPDVGDGDGGGEANWKDQDPEDQPFDVSIGSRGPIRADGPPRRPFEVAFAGRDFVLPREDVTLSKDSFPPLRQRQSDSLTADEGDDYHGAKAVGSFSSEIIPAVELEDTFVADDTFQDQGPGSVEIYKLDLFKEKTLLNPTPTVKAPVRGKSKLPKKTARVNWKTKTTEYKSTSPKIVQKQSNFFEEPRTESSPTNGEAFGVGGVPELQVGCEGLEASSHKLKRSADTAGGREKALGAMADPWLHVTPVSINLDYGELSAEEGYEEMDELLNLKKLETTTKRSKQNRGDMDASFLGDNFFRPPYPEKLPVRGDLGKVSTSGKDNGKDNGKDKDASDTPRAEYDSGVESMPEEGGRKAKERKKSNEPILRPGGRKLLWTEDVEEIGSGGEKRPEKRSILWGFGENEGAVTSDELHEQKKRQEEDERRRQEHHRRRQEARPRWPEDEERRRKEEDNRRGQYPGYERNEDARRRAQEADMRRERERWIENERKMQELEDLRRRAEQRGQDPEQDRRQRAHEDEIRRREEMARQLEQRRRQEAEDLRRRTDPRARGQSEDEEERRRKHREEELRRRQEIRRQEDIRRKQEMEDARRRQEEDARRQDPRMRNQTEDRRRTYDEEVRRREFERRRMEDERRRQSPERNLSESDRRDLEERQREWMLKRQQAEEEERRRQEMNRYSPPENLARPDSWPARNASRYDPREEEKRIREQQEEIERERKLRDYINRNRPINLDRAQNRRREEEERLRQREEDERRRVKEENARMEEDRRRLEEERRRYRPDTRYPGQNQTNASRDQDEEYQRKLAEHRQRMEEERRLQDYIRRNQPTGLPNQTASGRDLYEERRVIEAARQYDRTKFDGGRRHHGPSAPTNVDPRLSSEEARRQEDLRRRQEETRRTIERERQAAEERRKEAARREEEVRRTQSRRYEEDRKRQEAARAEAERMRKEQIMEQNRRSQGGRQRPRYEDRYAHDRRIQERLAQERRAQEERRRQEASQAPSNLMLDEHRRAMERNRQREEQQRRRTEAERRKQEEDRLRAMRQRENSRGTNEQWRRQEETRLNSLPVSARIIVRPGYPSSSSQPRVSSRFGNEIGFSGINPNRGVAATNFPAAPTRRPPIQSPGPCVWAVVQCCPLNHGRLVTCFESMGCPGVNWDPNPCRSSIADAARLEVMKYYEAAENDNY